MFRRNLEMFIEICISDIFHYYSSFSRQFESSVYANPVTCLRGGQAIMVALARNSISKFIQSFVDTQMTKMTLIRTFHQR